MLMLNFFNNKNIVLFFKVIGMVLRFLGLFDFYVCNKLIGFFFYSKERKKECEDTKCLRIY